MLPHSHDAGHHAVMVGSESTNLEDEQGIEWLNVQHRTLWGIKEMYLREESRKVKWYVSMSDDCLAFPNTIASFLTGYDPEMPVVFGHLVTMKEVQGLSPYRRGGGLTWPDVSAGVVLSKGALETIGPSLYSDRCPFFLSASMTLGLCCWKMGAYLADHGGFRPVMPMPRTAPMQIPGLSLTEDQTHDEELCDRTMVAKGFDETVRSRWMSCKVLVTPTISFESDNDPHPTSENAT